MNHTKKSPVHRELIRRRDRQDHSPEANWMRRFRELSWQLAVAETPAQTVRAMKDLDRHARSRIPIELVTAAHSPRWKYVPVEATPSMLDAALLAEWAADPKDIDKYHAAAYRAMIARAPKQCDGSLRGRQR